MSNVASNVTAGTPETTGAIYTALVSGNPTLPTDTDDTLTGFDCVGYVSEDGVKRAKEITSESIKAWGGDIVLRTRTANDTTFSFKMLEYLNAIVQQVIYGSDNVEGTALSSGYTVYDKPAYTGEHRVWVIDQIMTGDVKSRILIPDAVVTAVSEINYKDNEAAGYEITLGTIADSDGNTVIELLKTASA